MTQGIKIMIVDDNPDDRSLAIRELERNFKDIEIIEVVDADDLKKALKGDNYDLVITDYRIRWTNGIKVLKKVKKQNPECPVIMFTGTGNEEVAVQAMKSGLDDYVVKSPKHFIRLSASVHSALENARLRYEKKMLQEMYNRLFERVPVGLYSVDADGRIFAANRTMIELLGLDSKDEIHDHKAKDFYPDDELRKQVLERLKEKGVIKGYEIRLRKKDGEYIWVKENAYLTHDENGDIRYIEGSMEDITAVKEYEKKIIENEKRYRNIFESTGTAMVILNREMEISMVNKEAEKLLGYPDHELQGEHFTKFMFKENTDEIIQSMNPLFQDKKGRIDILLELQNRYHDVREVFLTASPMTESNLVLVSMIDITQQKKNLVTMEEAQEMFLVAFESNPLGMLLMNSDCGITEVNGAMLELTGYSEKELLSMKLSDLINNDGFCSRLEEITDEQQEDISIDASLTLRDGSSLRTSIKAVGVRRPDGSLNSIIVHVKKM